MEQELNDKLDSIIRLLAEIALRDKKQVEKIEVLSRAKFQPRDIAEMLGTTSGTVRVALVGVRRNQAKKERT